MLWAKLVFSPEAKNRRIPKRASTTNLVLINEFADEFWYIGKQSIKNANTTVFILISHAHSHITFSYTMLGGSQYGCFYLPAEVAAIFRDLICFGKLYRPWKWFKSVRIALHFPRLRFIHTAIHFFYWMLSVFQTSALCKKHTEASEMRY